MTSPVMQLTPNFPRGAVARRLVAVELSLELARDNIVKLLPKPEAATRKPVGSV